MTHGRADLPYAIVRGQNTTRFGYNTSDARIFKGDQTNARYYIPGIGSYDLSSKTWEHYPAGIAQIRDNVLQYTIKDHLTNIRAIVGTTATCTTPGTITAYDYYPYGKILRKYESVESRYKSTNHEKDSETGYDDRNARFYDDEALRFVQIDQLAESRPTLNPYNYVQNNPIGRTDPTGMLDDWVEKEDGTIYWDDKATSQKTTKKGETYLGKKVLIGTHSRDASGNEEINSAQFDLYLESNKEGISGTIMGNTVPADNTKSGILAEGLYKAKFGHRNAEKYKNELAIRIYNLDGTDGLPTVNGNPNPQSNGKTLTGVLFHMGNNYQKSLFDSKGHAYSNGCQTSGSYPNSRPAHNEFMKIVGTDYNGNYYLRSKPIITVPTVKTPKEK